MLFLNFISRYYKWSLLLSIATGALSGFSLAGIMTTIHRAVDSIHENHLNLLFTFICLWLLYGVSGILSENLMIIVSEKIAFRLKIALTNQILKKNIRSLEEIGENRLFAIIVEDIVSITDFIVRLPNIFINVAIVLGCYLYMLWLSSFLFIFNICFLITAVILVTFLSNITKKYMSETRDITDEEIKQFRFLIYGIKELFLNRIKRHDFLNKHLFATNKEVMELNIKALFYYYLSQKFGELLVLINIGCFILIIPIFYKIGTYILSGFLLAVMFSLSPLTTLLGFIPKWSKVHITLNKVQSYGFNLFDNGIAETVSLLKEEIDTEKINQLSLENIKFEYKDYENNAKFVIGPISLNVKSGELSFITGGNGTGKTTLIKIICGLYFPIEGKIIWNNESIIESNRERFYQNFSVIFSDYFLFKHLIGIEPKNISQNGNNYLNTLQLNEKVSINKGAFSTIDLSHGQKKRLALLSACLEDKPVYIFDEWAAGQDPYFKKKFYEDILLDLKRKKKIVIVVTHDNDYFHIADQLIKINDGKIMIGDCFKKQPISGNNIQEIGN